MPDPSAAAQALASRLDAVKATVAADAQEAANYQAQTAADFALLGQKVTDIETAANNPAPTPAPAPAPAPQPATDPAAAG